LLIAAFLSPSAAAEVNIRGNLDLGELATCIADSGAVFYGAHWCPVCRRQNAYFEEHADSLPYFECYDGARSEGKNGDCRELGIRSYPTWVFADGRVQPGAMTPLGLAAATDCLGR
jgi:hypothetical protein